MVWVLIVMILIAFIQLPEVIREKQWKELIVFSCLWIIAGTYTSIVIGLDDGEFLIPNHTQVVRTIMEEVGRMVEGWIQRWIE